MLTRADLVREPPEVLEREADGRRERLRVHPPVAAVGCRAVEAEQVSRRAPPRVAEQRIEIDLAELAVRVARQHPRVDHADEAAAAQLGELGRDLTMQALGG